MADNYLEKKMEERKARALSPVGAKGRVSLCGLLDKSKQAASFDDFIVGRSRLCRLVEAVAKIDAPLPFRFKLLAGEDAARLSLLPFCAEALPVATAYIVVCASGGVNDEVSVLLGRALQVIVLQAAEMGLSCACVNSFDGSAVEREFSLPSAPLFIVAVGRRSSSLPSFADGDFSLSTGLIIE